MDIKTISKIKTVLRILLIVVIAAVIVFREEIGNWIMTEITFGMDSQLHQLLR